MTYLPKQIIDELYGNKDVIDCLIKEWDEKNSPWNVGNQYLKEKEKMETRKNCLNCAYRDRDWRGCFSCTNASDWRPVYPRRREEFKPVKIEKVLFNDPATIVFWSDDTKTVVKAHNEEYDREKGLAMAIAKKCMGNKGSYFNEFKKWVNKN